MKNATSVLPLIADGHLPIGTILTCPISSVTAEANILGIQVKNQIFSDPTEAMRAVTGIEAPSDNGWIFWKVDDAIRGFTKPLEHVRAASKNKSTQSMVRTSDSHPLRIDTLSIPGLPGKFGMTFCPGKKSDSIYGGNWDRNLDKDVAAIRAWGANAVLTLLEDHEFELLGMPDFPAVMKHQPFQWHHLQIRDSDVPDGRFEAAWPNTRLQTFEVLKSGGSVVVHCRGGLGRTGMVVARFLVESGMPAEIAINMVRSARPGAIETWEQEEHVRASAISHAV